MSEDRVDRAALERSLAALVARTELPAHEGFFGPRSFAWRMFRERVLVTYAPRAVMLQYAYPPFAAASASYPNAKPGARFERAVSTLLSMIFGERERVLRDARRLHVIHERLHGVTEQGAAYHGNDRASLAWVLVTLLDASIRSYERHVGRIDAPKLFDETVRFAALFGLAPHDVPRTRAELDARVDSAELVVGAEARAMWRFLGEAEPWRERVARRLLAPWVAATLPKRLRNVLSPRMSDAQASMIERAGSFVRAASLPASTRFVTQSTAIRA